MVSCVATAIVYFLIAIAFCIIGTLNFLQIRQSISRTESYSDGSAQNDRSSSNRNAATPSPRGSVKKVRTATTVHAIWRRAWVIFCGIDTVAITILGIAFLLMDSTGTNDVNTGLNYAYFALSLIADLLGLFPALVLTINRTLFGVYTLLRTKRGGGHDLSESWPCILNIITIGMYGYWFILVNVGPFAWCAATNRIYNYYYSRIFSCIGSFGVSAACALVTVLLYIHARRHDALMAGKVDPADRLLTRLAWFIRTITLCSVWCGCAGVYLAIEWFWRGEDTGARCADYASNCDLSLFGVLYWAIFLIGSTASTYTTMLTPQPPARSSQGTAEGDTDREKDGYQNPGHNRSKSSRSRKLSRVVSSPMQSQTVPIVSSAALPGESHAQTDSHIVSVA